MTSSFCLVVGLFVTCFTLTSAELDTCDDAADGLKVSCTFNGDTCGWRNAVDNDFNWVLDNTCFEEPSARATMEGRPVGYTARLESPWICNTGQKFVSLRFTYYLGSLIKRCELSVYVKTNETTGRKLWSDTSLNGLACEFHAIESPIYIACPDSPFQIVFEAKKLSSGDCGFFNKNVDIGDVVVNIAETAHTSPRMCPSTPLSTQPDTMSTSGKTTTAATADTAKPTSASKTASPDAAPTTAVTALPTTSTATPSATTAQSTPQSTTPSLVDHETDDSGQPHPSTKSVSATVTELNTENTGSKEETAGLGVVAGIVSSIIAVIVSVVVIVVVALKHWRTKIESQLNTLTSTPNAAGPDVFLDKHLSENSRPGVRTFTSTHENQSTTDREVEVHEMNHYYSTIGEGYEIPPPPLPQRPSDSRVYLSLCPTDVPPDNVTQSSDGYEIPRPHPSNPILTHLPADNSTYLSPCPAGVPQDKLNEMSDGYEQPVGIRSAHLTQSLYSSLS